MASVQPSQTVVQLELNRLMNQLNSYPRLNSKLVTILSSIQAFFGLLSISFNTVAIIFKAPYARTYLGIWPPIVWWKASYFGMVSGNTKERCAVRSTMLLAAVSVLTALPMIPLAALGLSSAQDNKHEYFSGTYNEVCTNSTTRKQNDWCKDSLNPNSGLSLEDQWTMQVVSLSVLLCVGVLECIVALFLSMVCCRGMCCSALDESSTLRTMSDNELAQHLVDLMQRPPQTPPGGFVPPTGGIPYPESDPPPEYSEQPPNSQQQATSSVPRTAGAPTQIVVETEM